MGRRPVPRRARQELPAAGVRVLLSCLVLLSQCGTDAVAVDACREVELARCEAGVACGLIEDVVACERGIETRCLHGVATETGPGRVSLQRCGDAIRAAGECAERLDEEASPCECRELPTPSTLAETVCDLVLEPERLAECRFLLGDDADEVPDDACETPDAGPDD